MGKGHPCPHGTARCANCGGAHGARAEACARKREASQRPGGGRPNPPPCLERKAPEADAPPGQGGGEAETKGEVQPGAEEGAREEGAMD